MIEPPRLFTDARKDYDMQDVEVLGKIALEFGLQMKAEVRCAFERLLESIGTMQFQSEFQALFEYIMSKREEILANIIYTGITPPTMISAESLKRTTAIACLVPKRFGGLASRFQYGPYHRPSGASSNSAFQHLGKSQKSLSATSNAASTTSATSSHLTRRYTAPTTAATTLPNNHQTHAQQQKQSTTTTTKQGSPPHSATSGSGFSSEQLSPNSLRSWHFRSSIRRSTTLTDDPHGPIGRSNSFASVAEANHQVDSETIQSQQQSSLQTIQEKDGSRSSSGEYLPKHTKDISGRRGGIVGSLKERSSTMPLNSNDAVDGGNNSHLSSTQPPNITTTDYRLSGMRGVGFMKKQQQQQELMEQWMHFE